MGLLSWLHLRNTIGRLRGQGRQRPATPRFGGSIFMVFAIAAGVMGLIRFATQVSIQNQKLADDDQPGGDIIIRSEMLHVWVSPTLVDLAKYQAESGEIRTHKDSRRFLELRSQIKLCYVVILRGHQVDGNFVDMPFVRQPYNDAEHFPEFLDVLAAVAENSWGEPTDLLSTVSVHIVPEKFADAECGMSLPKCKAIPTLCFIWNAVGFRAGRNPRRLESIDQKPGRFRIAERAKGGIWEVSAANGCPTPGSVTSDGGDSGSGLPGLSCLTSAVGHLECLQRSARDRHPPRWWLGLSLPMLGSYADHIHLWEDSSVHPTSPYWMASRTNCRQRDRYCRRGDGVPRFLDVE